MVLCNCQTTVDNDGLLNVNILFGLFPTLSSNKANKKIDLISKIWLNECQKMSWLWDLSKAFDSHNSSRYYSSIKFTGNQWKKKKEWDFEKLILLLMEQKKRGKSTVTIKCQ